MKAIKGCIFDLDGVIVDTAKYHYLAWKRLAKELGFFFTIQDNERLKGVSRFQSLEILLSIGKIVIDDAEKYKLTELKNKWYVEYISNINQAEILPGVENFILNIKKRNIKIAIGSASKNAMVILKNIDMLKYFDVIIDGNKVTKAKPDPEVFLLAAKELKLMPEDCIVFEDAASGIAAAKTAGMLAIGIGSNEILGLADKVIPDFLNVSDDLLINF